MLFAAAAVAACAQTPAAPGSLVSIYGTELAAGLAQADTITLSPSINAGAW
jgi:ABC-type enterobactin transport system permease subunit